MTHTVCRQKEQYKYNNICDSSNVRRREMGIARSQKWGYVRIIAGTILGGVLGFYVMDRVEKSYKEKMNERLRKYEAELKKRDKKNQVEESL